MDLGIDFMLQSIVPKDVIIFQNPALNSPDPHLYICVGRKDGNYQFVVASTQEQSVKKRVAIRSQLSDTVVEVAPTDDCPLKKKSWIDCNTVFDFTHEKLKTLLNNNFNRTDIRMPDRHHELIVNGVCLSEIVDQSFILHLNTP